MPHLTITPTAGSPSAVLDQGSDAGHNSLHARDHLGLVHHVAQRLAQRLHDGVEIDELVSAGTIGLLQAMASFEPSRGLSFSTFAVPRIRGSILDELRRQDRVPRSVRRKRRAIAEARQAIYRRAGRPARNAELAGWLGIPDATLRQWQLDVHGCSPISLDHRRPSKRGDADERLTTADVLADERALDVDERLTREQRMSLLGRALRELRPQERRVVVLYYFKAMKLQEIADRLDLSASRVSQIRLEALARLRERMGSAVA